MKSAHRSGPRPAVRAAGTRRGTALWAGLISCLLLASHPGRAQTLTPAEVDSASAYLRAALAAPHEGAYLQVLTQVVVRPDTTDTSAVYDLIVRYDPRRYRDPHLGVYPLTFEDQFIQWGKRIAIFTRSTRWHSGRFYLQDQASGRQGWIPTGATRLLYPEKKQSFPGPVALDNSAGRRAWLQLIHATEPATSLQAMTRWLRLLRRESRDLVQLRRAARIAARDSTTAIGAAP